jgi:alkylation response protein AidB-like acyl-CoA dehydrogenase
LVVPEDQGGAGLGLVELCLLLREVGRRTAAVPALATLALAALPIARLGTPAQRAAWLPGVADGSAILTAALVDPLGDPLRPDVVATRTGDGWRLDGVRTNVPAGTVANIFLVPARTEDQTIVVAVRTDQPGVARTSQATTTGTPEALIELDGVLVVDEDRLGHTRDVLEQLVDMATVASCAVMAGVAAEAVRLTGAYTTEREQFGRPIASFQAVTQRAADAWVDAQSIELTMMQAAWRIDAGLPADREVAVAKFFAAEAGQRAVHAAQHLHGGMGVDRDYPLHRYFLWAKQHELFLGGANRQLLRLGASLAAEGPARSVA